MRSTRGFLVGIGVLLLIGLTIYYATRKKEVPQGIVIGKPIVDAEKDSLELQGISFQQPVKIKNTDTYLLPITVKVFETPRKKSVSTLYETLLFPNHINFVFLTQEFEVIRTLVTKKASISRYMIPSMFVHEPSEIEKIKHILYLIAFEDTNKDNILNSKDDHDLYISDLDGGNLRRITSGYDVVEFEFVEDYTQVLIRSKERGTMKEEHKRESMVLYDIPSQKQIPLKSLQETLKTIENQLNTQH